MFTCDYCQKATGPHVKPIVVVDPMESRARTYVNPGPEGAEVVTMGHEIVREYRKCPPCAGTKQALPTFIDDSILARIATMQEHAVRCKKALGECKTCSTNAEAFAGLPMNAVSKALEPKMDKPARFCIATLTVEALIDRTNDKSKRAKADVKVAMGVLDAYRSRGGGFL